MASTFSDKLRLELIATGEQSGSWGITTNANIGTLIEQAVAGVAAVSMIADTNYTLTANNGVSDEARCAVLSITSTLSLTATRDVVCPTKSKLYIVKNATTGGQSIRLKTTGGTGVTVASGTTAFVFCDGANVVDVLNAINAVTVRDALFTMQDDVDITKQMRFQLSAITTGTTRTLTVPDVSDTLVALAATQTLTNKTLTAPALTTPTITTPTISSGATLSGTFSGGTFTGTTHTNPDNTVQTLTDAATIAWDTSLGAVGTVTLGGNRIMGPPTNLKKGTYILHILQDGTGSRTITSWNAVFKWQSAIAPILTTTANRRDIFSFICDGTNLYGNAMLDVR